jgi:hypothetical protein
MTMNQELPPASQEFAQVKAQVAATSGAEIVRQVLEIAEKVEEVKAIEQNAMAQGSIPQRLEGDAADKESARGKAVDAKVAVQKVFIAVQTGKDLPLQLRSGLPVNAEIKRNANVILTELSSKLQGGERMSEIASPFVYEIVQKVLTGDINTTDELAREFKNYGYLKHVSKGIFDHVQEAFISATQKLSAVSEEEAKKMFGIEERKKDENGEEEIKTRQELEEFQRKVAADEQHFGDLILRIRSQKDIKAEKAERIVRSLIYSTEKVDVETLSAELLPHGFSEQEIESLAHYSRDYKKLNTLKGREGYRYLDQYNLVTPELKTAFSVEGLERFLEDDTEHPGKKKLSDKGRRYLKRRALSTLNQLMKQVDASPDTDFHQNFSDLREGQAYFELQQMIGEFQTQVRNSSDLKAKLGEQNVADIDYYIKNGVIQELSREKNLRELFHTMGIYIKTLGPDKYGEFISRYNLSDIDTVTTSDFSGKILSLAMSEYERYIQFDRMKNKGELRTSLFAGKSHLDMMYRDNDDRKNLKERLLATLQGLKSHVTGQDGLGFTDANRARVGKNSLIQKWDIDNIEEFEDWEIDRALKYAQGIHLTQTIRGFEIIASGRPPNHFRGSADNMVDMAGVLNPNWKWQLGRGGPQAMPTYREAMIADMIKKRPERNLWKRIAGDLWGNDKWNPEEIHEKYGRKHWDTSEKMMEKWAEVEDQWLYKDINFRKMVKLLGLGGLAGRGGWRMTGFRDGIDYQGSEYEQYISSIQEAILNSNADIDGEKAKAGFKFDQATYDQLARSVGVGSRFFFDGMRAEAFAKEELWRYLAAHEGLAKDDLPSREQGKLWYEYTFGEKGDTDGVTLPGGEKMTFMELSEVKTLMLRGMNFRDLMKRSPMDFLNSLVNITPELLTGGLGGTGDEFFIFNEHALEHKVHELKHTKGEREELLMQIKVKQADMRRMWGTDKIQNQEHLLRVRDFYKEVEAWGKKRLGLAPDAKLSKQQIEEQVWEPMYRSMDLAVEKVRLRNAAQMSREDIVVMSRTNPKEVDQELTEMLREMFYGEGKKGLVSYFNGLNETCGVDQNGKEIAVNQWTEADRGFFYHMGRSWYNELGHNFPPDTSDVDWRYILHNMGANSGENMVKRLWGDLNAYNGVMSKLMGLDDILAKCAGGHDMKPIMEIHAGLRGLKGIAGDESVYEMQYYLAQVVARYFQEHSNARLPFLVGQVYSAFNGGKLSLSRIYGGMHAMTLTTDGINKYFQELAHGDFIAEEGIYGVSRLQQALGADWQKLIVAEILPNVSTALFLFLLYKYMKDAFDESSGKKKK